MLIFKFIRPVSYQSTAFDAIVIFSIYALSPLQLRQNIVLVLGYSAGILFINYLFKTGTNPLTLNVAVSAQVIVHVLGLGSALQMQSWDCRKSFKAYIDERDAKEMVAYLANIDPLTKSSQMAAFFQHRLKVSSCVFHGIADRYLFW